MNYLNFTPSPPSQSTVILDSGCIAYFLLGNSKCKNKVLPETPLEVCLPNGATIASTHTATLNLPLLPHESRHAHILPGLTKHSLLSVGKICDSGCAVTFTATKVEVTNGGSKICMWRIPLETSITLQITPEHYAHNVYEQKSIQDTITYLHA
jgi:hypothetical protein